MIFLARGTPWQHEIERDYSGGIAFENCERGYF
jgi:hypothetical protein